MTFVPRGMYTLSFLREDARTRFGRKFDVKDKATVILIGAKLGANREELAGCLRQWGQGSAWIEPSPEQVRWIRG
jgi:hypothetical protein